jgi:hypothetical protein
MTPSLAVIAVSRPARAGDGEGCEHHDGEDHCDEEKDCREVIMARDALEKVAGMSGRGRGEQDHRE